MITCPKCSANNSDQATTCFNCGNPLKVSKPAEHEYALKVGSFLKDGRYSIGRILGQGGFGITYLCSDITKNKTVAIKELFPSGCYRKGNTVHPTGVIQPDDFERIKDKFIEEGQRLRKFDHPGIVKVISTFKENNTAYIVMVYVEGRNLDDLVREKGTLSENEALRLITRVANALDYIHSQNYLHRDIKPSNVILTKDGRAVLIDFGSARQFAAETRTMTAILTPGYAPIEQYASKVRQLPSLDIYALGATLYYILTGKSPEEVHHRIQGFELEPPDKINPDISGKINDLVMWMLQIQATDRPQSISQLFDKLKKKTSKESLRPEPRSVPGAVDAGTRYDTGSQTIKSQIPYVLITIAVFLLLYAIASQYGNVLNTKSTKTRQQAEEFYRRGCAHLANYEYDPAILEFTKAIRRDPEFTNAYLKRGIAYSDKGDYDNAIVDYTKAIELKQNFALAYLNRGIAYYHKGEYGKAIFDCHEAEKYDPYLENVEEWGQKAADEMIKRIPTE